jgi:hypothetical protein
MFRTCLIVSPLELGRRLLKEIITMEVPENFPRCSLIIYDEILSSKKLRVITRK